MKKENNKNLSKNNNVTNKAQVAYFLWLEKGCPESMEEAVYMSVADRQCPAGVDKAIWDNAKARLAKRVYEIANIRKAVANEDKVETLKSDVSVDKKAEVKKPEAKKVVKAVKKAKAVAEKVEKKVEAKKAEIKAVVKAEVKKPEAKKVVKAVKKAKAVAKKVEKKVEAKKAEVKKIAEKAKAPVISIVKKEEVKKAVKSVKAKSSSSKPAKKIVNKVKKNDPLTEALNKAESKIVSITNHNLKKVVNK